MTKYAILSDIHAHAHSVFARTNANGVNSRLQGILNEMERAAACVLEEGGNVMVIAGDIMHQRGQIDPEVLNPVRATIERILDMGVDIHAIPGNHDLKSAETSELSSSIQNLSQIRMSGGMFSVYNEPSVRAMPGYHLGFVPWRNTREQLLRDLEAMSIAHAGIKSTMDVFIHAGIDGVLSGMPAHGLTDAMLAGFGFRRVFAGHYHNHKSFGGSVVSIGATTHHNWGDVGTRAGFLIADTKSLDFKHYPSKQPSFVDISGMSEQDLLFVVPGNYVRLRGAPMTSDQIADMRNALTDMGAAGISIEVPRATVSARPLNPTAKPMTLPESIEAYVKSAPPAHVSQEDVIRRAIETLHDSQAIIA